MSDTRTVQTLSPSTKGGALAPYQKRLLLFLSVATFFEGYDFFALTQVLPHLRREFALDHGEASALLGFVNFGTVLAYLAIGRADQIGRRKLLSITIVGYAVASALSGLAPNLIIFAILQLIARIFLIGEWATSMVMAAEEFPATRRGLVLGTIGAMASLGSILCVLLVPPLTKAFGWRSVYLVGLVPLLLIAYARRGLRETDRYQALQTGAGGQRVEKKPLRALLQGPYRKRALQLGAIWFFTYLATQNAVSVWKDYAMTELGTTERAASGIMTIAALVAMPLSFLTGPFIDRVGRRWGASAILASTSLGVLGSYSLRPGPGLTVALIATVFGVSAVLTVLNALTTELFPTPLRGAAFGLSNNILGRIGYWMSPFAVGAIAEGTGWGTPLRATAAFPWVAIALIWIWLPETRGRELEETSAT
jgi:MFS transporter, putative metabolite:H+ symporter